MNLKTIGVGAALLAGIAAAIYAGRETPTLPAPASLPQLVIPASIPGMPAPSAPAQPDTQHMVKSLERSTDLRATYDKYKDSRNPSERNTAYRAWSACFPTFVAPEGQAISLEGVTRAVPPNAPGSAQRIDAYRALMGRCKNFSDMSRQQIVRETERQKSAWSNGAAAAPGELAAKLLTDGEPERALQAARAVLASRDPAAISSLREYINQYFVLQVDAQSAPPDLRPDLRSLAFGMAACELGLECGPDSMTALQQCANTGACGGGVADRYLASVANPADRERLLRETQQVTAAIRSGDFKALGL